MREVAWPNEEFPDLDTRQDYGDLLPKLIVIEDRMRRDVGEAENMDAVRYRLLEDAWNASMLLRNAIESVVKMDAKERT